MAELRLMTPEESAEWERRVEQERAEHELHKGLVDACAADGGHLWELHLELDDEVGGPTVLDCEKCPAGIDDLYPDGSDLLYAEFDNGLQVEAGRHTATEPWVIPVYVEVNSYKTWTDLGWEYDVEIDIDQRGPVRPDSPPSQEKGPSMGPRSRRPDSKTGDAIRGIDRQTGMASPPHGAVAQVAERRPEPWWGIAY